MKTIDAIILSLLLILVSLGLYVIWLNVPTGPAKYDAFRLENTEKNALSSNFQFYPNMRYKNNPISYSISNSCDAKRKTDAEEAFSSFSERTMLTFYNTNEDAKAEIRILCSDITPTPEEKGHFIAGEGGPSEIINTTAYSVILTSKVLLFRQNECKKPNVAIHEILHALGFDHNNNPKSIMYPITSCDQEIDNTIINEINRLYKIESAPDLAIKEASANKIGRYLNFEINITNMGLFDSQKSELFVYASNELIKRFDLGTIEIGTRKSLTVENLKIPRSADMINFEIQTPEKELNTENNKIKMQLVALDKTSG